MRSGKQIYMLCECSLMVAAAQILGMLKLWKMPWGGSVTLSMLPVVLFSLRWGTWKGMVCGLALGVLQILMDGASAISIQSVFGDYLFAYMAVGLAGAAGERKPAWLWGALIGGGARFLVHFVVGATVWAMYMPESFAGMPMGNPWLYSLLYNLFYMVPNILITVLVLWLLSGPLHRYYNGEDLKEKT